MGAESLRERGSTKAYPVVNVLHVWWARRPLVASRAAVAASLLPAWPELPEDDSLGSASDLAAALRREFPGGESEYHAWFLRAMGIVGDPVAGRLRINAARTTGERLEDGGYGYARAFTVSPDPETVTRIQRLARLRADVDDPPSVLDPFAGGGSIPFEAGRLGCRTIANELNPVAAAILEGTLRLPHQLGRDFAGSIERWGSTWSSRVQDRLDAFFPRQRGEDTIAAYVWAHTVPCPSTGRPTPLVPDFWLSKGAGGGVAVRLEPNEHGDLDHEIIEGRRAAEYGNRSTYGRGAATSVWTGEPFSGEYIREHATSGRMGEMLLAVCVTRRDRKGRVFRVPSSDDRAAIYAAKSELAARLPKWEIQGLVPSEPIDTVSNYDRGHRMYGINRWSDFFTSRQLLSLITAAEELDQTVHEAAPSLGHEAARALRLYLAFALDKAIDYNSRQASWSATRSAVRNTFDKHNYAFKWAFAEFDAARALIPWAVKNAATNQRKLFELVADEASLFSTPGRVPTVISLGSATAMDLPDQSVDAVVTDPPYYDNVMYGECADFFYVWLKRTLNGDWPELVSLPLSDKQAEAVANRALFKDVAAGRSGGKDRQAKSAADLADEHYERLLTGAFLEAHRVLKDDGVLTVMFTHKRVDAWDTLGQSLLEAGFSISSSWPVHTESEHSLHQAKKNSASSTILLGCRKRASTEPAYWSDIRREVEEAAEEAAKRFSAEGIKGVDLTLATYGPALSVLSRNWPVYTGNLTEDGEREKLRPDAALDLARHRVALLKKRELLGGRDVEFDRATDWWLLAWNDFQAAQFPVGEALKLCIAMDLELDDVAKQHKLVKAASGDVTLLTPAQRRTAKSLDADAGTWPTLVDALHALMLTHDEEGLAASRSWLARTGKGDDERFAALVEAAIHAVPRTRDKDGDFSRPEARILESLRATLFDWIEAPPEPELGEALTLDFAEG